MVDDSDINDLLKEAIRLYRGERNMNVTDEHLKKVNDLADWVELQEGGWGVQVLRTFGSRKFVEAGDISAKALIPEFIKRYMVFKVEHVVDEYNSPDYGITHLGYQVYQVIQHRRNQKK